MIVGRTFLSIVAALAAVPSSAGARQLSAQPPAQTATLAAPPSDVVTRDEERRATVRAIRLSAPLKVDGKLDEDVYSAVPPITDFIQTMPKNNAEPSERTDAWVMFDGKNIYIAARCWDSAPPDKWIANEMRRDANQLRQNDHFGVMLDTFFDRRNGYVFYANPLGGRMDQTMADEGDPNVDWNPVWEVRTGRFDGGWTIEMAIPFKTLRYVSGPARTWGIQLRRAIRRKNEWLYLNPLPLAIGGPQGFFRISAAATLVDLDLPPASRNVELKPYGISRVTTDRIAHPGAGSEVAGDFGIDAKYGLTANLTADVTYNTDFAQVEVDEQQVNLTRFSLFFPEKRDFFLEGRGVFSFASFPTTGGPGGGGAVAGAAVPASGTSAGSADTPSLFYSRRIGLSAGRVVPIEVGTRVTGKAGRYGIGVLNIETGDEEISKTPKTNFTVVRVKRDLLRRSRVGLIFTNRSRSMVAPGSNQAYGADAIFSFSDALTTAAYYARTATPGLKSDNESYQARVDYSPDLYGARIEYLKVGDHFNPEIGFVRRDDFKRTFGSARYSPRPRSIKAVRQFSWEGSVEYFVNGQASVESRQQIGRFSAELENSDRLTIEGHRNYELLLKPFNIATDVSIPAAGYAFSDAQISYSLGQQRRASGVIALQQGHFYDGSITAVSYSAARVAVLKQFSVEPTVSINRVRLPAGAFTSTLLRARTDYAFSPRRFASALVQYNSIDRTFSSNLRFRWEYRPGSELFVVYTDERDTLVSGFPALKSRAFVVKVNRLLQF